MATALTTIEQLKHEFCSHYAYLPEQDRLQLWLKTVSTLPSDASANYQPSIAQQIPRSMAYSSTMLQPASDFSFWDRGHSAPAASAMRRSTSASSANNLLQRCNSNVTDWQPTCDDSFNAYTLYSQSASMRQQPSLQPIAETTVPDQGTVVYSPDEYINFVESSDASPHPLPPPQAQPHNSRQLHVQLTQNVQWSPSLDYSTSPSTPSTALMTPVTQSSNPMSRQSSFNPHFFDESSMLRIQSDSSSLYQPVLPEDGSFSLPVDVEPKVISDFADNSHFLANFTGPANETFLSSAPVSSASVSALASSDDKLYLVEDMRRSASTSDESDSSNASASSPSSRHARRGREINAQAVRCKIAPKAIANTSETKSPSSNVQLMQIRSEDGSSKSVGVITKTPYVRPQHPKIKCPQCSGRSEGFRGTHELERHIARAHSARRKGFICVDASADKKFLANCKHCRNKKVYGAYYNAAAHLRRAHFHPRKRGRKGKHDEKRGGIGGGDHPPMDLLKQHWIREIQVENETLVGQSPDDDSDSVEPTITSSHDETYNMDFSYPVIAQPTNDVSMSLDPSQYIDYSLCMTDESEPLYNPALVYATNEPVSTTSDINEFEFEAYRA